MTAEYENREEIKEALKADAQTANQTLILETKQLTTPTSDGDDKDKDKSSKEAGEKAGEKIVDAPLLGPLPPPPPSPSIDLWERLALKKELQAQYEAYKKELERLKKREIDVSYYKVNKTRGSTAGEYFSDRKSIAVYNSDKPLETVVAHEKQHRNNDFATFTTASGETYRALNAPMGLAQYNKLAQADEIGAYITEVLTLRQKYIKADEQGRKKLVDKMENDERFGWYFKGVKYGTYDPLSKNPQNELDSIGRGCAIYWENNLYNTYSEALENRTKGYFEKSRFQDVKPNDYNYNKALSAMLTIGGHDFSSSVKGSLTTDERFSKIDEAINSKENKCDVIEKAAKEGIKLGEKDDSLEERMAAYLVKGQKTTGKEVVLGEGEYVWTEEMLNAIKTAKNSYGAKKGVYSPEQIQEFNEEWNKLDSIKIGDKGSKEEEEAMKNLASSFRKMKDYDSCTPLEDVLTKAYFQQSNSLVTEEEKSAYKKAYNNVKKEGDEAFEKIPLGYIKERVNEILSGKDGGGEKWLSADKVKECEEYRNSDKTPPHIRDEGEKTSTEIPNFNAPILDPKYDQKISDLEKKVAECKKKLEQLDKTPEESNKKQPQAANTGSSQVNNKTGSPNLVALLYNERTGRC